MLVVWHSYVTESFYLWPIGWLDTLIPFLIGIAECMVVFFVRPDGQKGNITFGAFVFCIAAVQIFGAVAYGNALYKRNKKETKRLYCSIFSATPRFTEYLLEFFTRFDFKNIVVLLIYFFVSVVVTCLVGWYKPFLEIVFFLLFVIEIIVWKTRLDLPRSLRKDRQMGPYFSGKEMTR